MAQPEKFQPARPATLEDAIALAVEAHRGQTEKAGQPYVLHVLRVMFRCETELERILAVLHDVVEDTGRSFEDLRRLGFSEQVLGALDCVTKREGESYEQFVERAASNPIARRVKLADLEDNMDLRRLPAVGEKDAERLGRYVRAWRRLKELEQGRTSTDGGHD
jgi:(p)ppGpp synthase/HD superfamily hydrolase